MMWCYDLNHLLLDKLYAIAPDADFLMQARSQGGGGGDVGGVVRPPPPPLQAEGPHFGHPMSPIFGQLEKLWLKV